MQEFLTNIISHFTYVALMAVLIVAGLGVPIPEDVPLALAGYTCNEEYSPIAKALQDPDAAATGRFSPAKRVPNLYLMIISGMIGVLCGDSIVFSIGRKGVNGDNFVCRHIRKVMHSKRREKVERHFARHGNLTVFMGRFAPGFRSLVFAFAGMSKMSYGRFLLIDGLAALISVPTFVILGYYFAANIEQFFGFIHRIKGIILPVVLVLTVGAIALYVVRRRRARPVIEQG